MYTNYCAPCHGTDGKGHGPVAASLKESADGFDRIRGHHGKFPDTHVAAILQFGAKCRPTDRQLMPVWGPILGNMNRANLQDKQLRISNLTRYLESIQAR